MEGTFSTVGGYLQYCGGITVVHVEDSFSTVEVVQYSGDNISTVGDSFSTVEGIQYTGEITSVQWGDNISTVLRVFSTVGKEF